MDSDSPDSACLSEIYVKLIGTFFESILPLVAVLFISGLKVWERGYGFRLSENP